MISGGISADISADISAGIAAIYNRRSIRRFSDAPIPKKDITEILQCGIKAPSSKNRQPWRYIVLQNKAKEEMLEVFRRGIQREEREHTLLPGCSCHMAGAKQTAAIMEKAPVIVMVVNTLGRNVLEDRSPEDRIADICNVQSIGASVQNMLLAAEDKGIGSLWICDIYFAYEELSRWLGCEGDLVAAVAFGYPEEAPGERPRKRMEDVVEWRG